MVNPAGESKTTTESFPNTCIHSELTPDTIIIVDMDTVMDTAMDMGTDTVVNDVKEIWKLAILTDITRTTRIVGTDIITITATHRSN